MYYLTPEDIHIIISVLSSFFINHKEPTPSFNEAHHDKLESVMAHPKDTFDGQDLYPDIYSKAACYFYFIIKIHPFFNGNKRVSIVATYVFLRKNGYYFEVEEDMMYTFAKEISNSHDNQDADFTKVKEFITLHTVSEKDYKKKSLQENGIMSRLTTLLANLLPTSTKHK